MALFAAMKLPALLSEVEVVRVDGPGDAASLEAIEIAEVRDDSRAVGPGDLFVAVRGLTVDGHRFIGDAAARGAAAVVVEDGAAAVDFPGPRIVVRSTTLALAHIAARRFGDPARALTLIAVTGTNGKTTTSYLVESILRAAGRRVGVLGTVNYRYGGGPGFSGPDVEKPSNFTTPMPLDLHRVLAEMRAAGCTHVVMETSSHALALGRLEGIAFRAAAFTNLTQDHLDLHATMEAYYDAKAQLFRRGLGPRDGVGVIFLDGEYGERMANEVIGERLLVSLSRASADVHPLSASTSIDGIVAELASPLGPLRLRSRLLGAYNLANLAVASGVAVALGVPSAAIERGVAELGGVPGRVERVENPARLPVLVDYAHTPDALENVIAALRPLTAGRLLCVFGCGGDRDRGKRPKMGRVVAERADIAIVTSDNPRTEEPAAIVADIVEGVRASGAIMLDRAQLRAAARGAFVEIDRRAAIHAAVFAMQQNDVLLVAGKGHEDYQIIGRTKHPFDDRAIARAALAARAAATGGQSQTS